MVRVWYRAIPYQNIRHVHFTCNTDTSGGLCVLNRCYNSGAADCTMYCVGLRPKEEQLLVSPRSVDKLYAVLEIFLAFVYTRV